jgi:hypothetical protein
MLQVRERSAAAYGGGFGSAEVRPEPAGCLSVPLVVVVVWAVGLAADRLM